MSTASANQGGGNGSSSVEDSLQRALERLSQSRPFAKQNAIPQVLELARRLLLQPDGIERLYAWAPQLEEAGVFTDSDWAEPQTLLPSFVGRTLQEGDRQTLIIECVSLLRTLAIANEEYVHPGFSSEQAWHFLTQVLAHNLNRVFPGSQSEVARIRQAEMNEAIDVLFGAGGPASV